MDAKPRELYLLFRAYKVGHSEVKVSDVKVTAADQNLITSYILHYKNQLFKSDTYYGSR